MPPPPWQRRDRPAILLVLFNTQAVRLSGGLELHIVIVPVVAGILHLMEQVVEMGHFVEHGRANLRHGPVEILRAYVDLTVHFPPGFPYLLHAAPAIGPAPAVRGYGDGRVGQLPVVKVLVE